MARNRVPYGGPPSWLDRPRPLNGPARPTSGLARSTLGGYVGGLLNAAPGRIGESSRSAGQTPPFGIVRREFLQVGFWGSLGRGLAALLAGKARAGTGDAPAGPRPRAKSMILIFLTGGLCHLD